MSALKQALTQLRNSISRLEGGVHTLEYTLAGRQRDMFGATPAPAAKKDGNGFPLENAVIAQRLDKAIKKVEELLEG